MPQELSESIRWGMEEVRQGRTTALWLGGLRLEEIPVEVMTLTQLEELDLSDNELRAVPSSIRLLSRLKRLVLAGNPIQSVPDVPGLILDWESYVRCRGKLTPEHV